MLYSGCFSLRPRCDSNVDPKPRALLQTAAASKRSDRKFLQALLTDSVPQSRHKLYNGMVVLDDVCMGMVVLDDVCMEKVVRDDLTTTCP